MSLPPHRIGAILMSEMVSDAERYVSLRKQALEAQAKANELHVAVQKLRTYMIQQYPKS